MERHSGKRGAAGGTSTPKKECGVRFKNTTTDKDQSPPLCNRIGCSGRIKYNQNQNTKIGSSEKVKSPKPSFSSSNGNEMPGNSSRVKRPSLDLMRKMPPRSESSPSTESSQSGDSKSQEMILPSSTRNLARQRLGWNSSLSSNITSRKMVHPKLEASNSKTSVLRTQNNNNNTSSSSSSSSSFSTSTTSSSTNGPRNLKCNSISNNVTPSSSSSESKSASKNITKKKLPEGGRQKTCVFGISGTRSERSNSASVDNSKTAGPVRTRRPTNTNNGRTRLNVGGGPHSSDPQLRVNVGRPQFSANGSSSSYSSLSSNPAGEHDFTYVMNHEHYNMDELAEVLLAGSSSSYSSLSSNPAGEHDFTYVMNHEHYNMDGLAEVLLALERIRQEEELTHEQLLDLESNLFFSGLNQSDQHRDMRLDIDNMSYEELLALEEKMGSVSTALSDDALLKCIKSSKYNVGPPEVRVMGSGEDGDEIKCSICQEDYALGDETGELVGCQHEYHLTCINQWLRLKNWCPICKASVAAAPQESSLSE